MIDDKTFPAEEIDLSDLFREAGWKETHEIDEGRIAKVTDRAIYENLVKTTSSFMFLGFREAIVQFMGLLCGSVVSKDEDYKP